MTPFHTSLVEYMHLAVIHWARELSITAYKIFENAAG